MPGGDDSSSSADVLKGLRAGAGSASLDDVVAIDSLDDVAVFFAPACFNFLKGRSFSLGVVQQLANSLGCNTISELKALTPKPTVHFYVNGCGSFPRRLENVSSFLDGYGFKDPIKLNLLEGDFTASSLPGFLADQAGNYRAIMFVMPDGLDTGNACFNKLKEAHAASSLSVNVRYVELDEWGNELKYCCINGAEASLIREASEVIDRDNLKLSLLPGLPPLSEDRPVPETPKKVKNARALLEKREAEEGAKSHYLPCTIL